MLIGVPAETVPGETRVAVTPETAGSLSRRGTPCACNPAPASLPPCTTDAALQAAGAEITDAAGAFACELVLKVRSPSDGEAALMKPGTAVVGMLNPFDAEGLQRLATAGLTSFALEAARHGWCGGAASQRDGGPPGIASLCRPSASKGVSMPTTAVPGFPSAPPTVGGRAHLEHELAGEGACSSRWTRHRPPGARHR